MDQQENNTPSVFSGGKHILLVLTLGFLSVLTGFMVIRESLQYKNKAATTAVARVGTDCDGSCCWTDIFPTKWVMGYCSDDAQDPVVNDITTCGSRADGGPKAECCLQGGCSKKGCGAEQIDIGPGKNKSTSKRYPGDCPPTDVPPPDESPTPTITPTVPTRPKMCVSASTTESSLAPGQTTILTSQSSAKVYGFIYQFYNLNNLYSGGTPKAFCVESGGDIKANPQDCLQEAGRPQRYQLVYTGTRDLDNPLIGHRQLSYEQIFVRDYNVIGTIANPIPGKVQFNAYFTDANGNVSQADANCVASIFRATTTITPTRTITPTITITITPTRTKTPTPPTKTKTPTPTRTKTPTPPTKTKTPTPTRTKTPTPPTKTKTPTPTRPPPTACLNYGVDEHSADNLSNIIWINLTAKAIGKVNTLYLSSDGISDGEGMDGNVYLVANKKSPALYRVNKTVGGSPKVTRVAGLSRAYEGISFRPTQSGVIWGGGRNGNVYKLSLTGAQLKEYTLGVSGLKSIVWDNSGTNLYISNKNSLIKYSYNSTSDTFTKLNTRSLPGPTDAMDMTSDGWIVAGYKSGQSIVFYFLNPNTGETRKQSISLASYNQQLLSSGIGTPFNNLDAFTWNCGNHQ